MTCGENGWPESWKTLAKWTQPDPWQGREHPAGSGDGNFFIGPKAPLTTRANNESGAEDGAVAKPRLPRLRMVRHALVEIRQTGDSHGGTTKS